MKKIIRNTLFFVCPAILAGFLFGLLAFYIYAPRPVKEYRTLTDITMYTKQLPEQPESDDNNWLDPYYVSFDQSRLPSWPIRFLRWLNLGQPEPWSPKFLAHQLKKLRNKSLLESSQDGRNTILHIRAQEPKLIYVFGDVHGAFHSMVRNLNYLKENNVIGDDLVLLDKNIFLVFNGDYIDRSPYSIDSLILMSLLLEKNPHNVIYLRGNHEYHGHWEDFGLKRELFIRGRAYSQQEIPFKEQVLEFFKILPQSVYVSGKNDVEKMIRISFNSKQNLPYDEEKLGVDIAQHDEPIKETIINPKLITDTPIDVVASFQTEDWRLHNRVKQGLGFLEQDHGSSAWAVLSSPIYIHKEFLNFNSDAFVRVDVNNRAEEGLVTLFHQDTRTMLGYQIEKPLNIVTGHFSGADQDKSLRKVVKIASTMSLERGVPTIGKMAQLGMNLAVSEANFLQDKNKPMYRLYIDNDNYIPRWAKKNIDEFIKSGINYVLFPVGTPTILSYIDGILKDDVLVLFPITGAQEIHSPKYKNIINYRVSYADEAQILIKYMRKEYASLKFAFLYQDDSFGKAPLDAAIKELEQAGITNYVPLPYTRGNINFETQIKELQKAQPDAVGFFSTAKAAQEFIRQVGISTVANTKLFGISFAGELTIKRFAKRHGLDILFASVVPNPRTSQLPIVQHYRRAFVGLNVDFDVYSLEAFIGTRLFIEMIESMKGAITPKRVIDRLESYRNFDFHGLRMNFNPKDRSLSEHIWLETRPENEWQRVSVVTKEFE